MVDSIVGLDYIRNVYKEAFLGQWLSINPRACVRGCARTNLGYLWKNFIRTIWGIINYISVWEYYRVISGNEYAMVNNVSQNR